VKSQVFTDKTALFIGVHGAWRIFAAAVAVVGPLYGWVLFYYLSTGAWHQPASLVMMYAPVLATFVVPLAIGAWLLGFRRWYLAVGSVLAAVITSLLPSRTIANQLLPGGYINLAIILILLMIALRAFQYWRDYIVLKLPVSRYTNGACWTVVITVAGLLALLIPTRIWF
jgi:hypothetical protein